MKKSTKLEKLDQMIEKVKSVNDLPFFFNAVIYNDEDENLCHAYGPKGKVISARTKKIKKKLRKAFKLSKEDNIYLVISQFKNREQYHKCFRHYDTDNIKT